jgi:hypothetical protein
MAVQAKLERDLKRVVIHVSGTVLVEDVLAAIDGIVADPDFGPGYDVLSDHRQVELPLTPDATKAWLGHLERGIERVRGCRWAAVATSPASYGMMRMLSVLIKDVLTLEVFKEMDAAERWLATGKRSESP